MANAAYDLRYLRAGVNNLENYLLSSDIYWPIGVKAPSGQPPYPQLTLGGLLLAQNRAHARELTTEQRAELAELDELMDSHRSRWRVAWGKKARAEFHSRLNLWRDFLEEYRDNPDANADRYSYEVGRRVMLDLLQNDAEDVPEAETSLLKGLDGLLRAVFVPGEFVWDPELQSSFPQDPYWYLYGRPRES